MWGHMDGYGWSWGSMGLGMVGISLFWLLLIVAIVLLAKWLLGQSSTPGRTPEKTALDILKERYARGDIDKAEYDQRKHDLEH